MNHPLGRFSLEQLHDGNRIIARSWADDAFKNALLSDPMGTLAQEGFEVPAGLTIAVHENTGDTLHVVLPPKPSVVLTDEDLAGAAGGFTFQVSLGTMSSVGPMSAVTGNGCTGGASAQSLASGATGLQVSLQSGGCGTGGC